MIWLPVKVLFFDEIYEASDTGRIRSSINRHGSYKGRILKYNPSHDGYARVTLFHTNKWRQDCYVHKIIASTFLNHPYELDYKQFPVNHEDGNKYNNHVDNLKPMTSSQNQLHSYATGLNSNLGETHIYAKLTEGQVIEIRFMAALGIEQKEIANRFKVSKSTVHFIVNRITWKHI